MKNFILKGNICFSRSLTEISVTENGYLVCEDGISRGVFETIPQEYASFPVLDYGTCLIIPCMNDLHTHAPQFSFRGMYADEELMDWLQKYTFPEESKHADPEYSRKAYSLFVNRIASGATGRACIFATAHTGATEILMEMLSNAGLGAFVGRVNMDINAPDSLREQSAGFSEKETIKWIEETKDCYPLVKPILTPRFVPSCSRELLSKLSAIESKYRIPVQSHLSESAAEVETVHKLFPEYETYGDVYSAYGLFGEHGKTVMAHCVRSERAEIDKIKRNGVYIAHCPASNANLRNGVAPIRKYLNENLHVGLGTDVAGGHSESMFHAIFDAIQMSKLRSVYVDANEQPLTFSEGFFLATKGGGEFFGNVGSFENGYSFDALVLDDGIMPYPQQLSANDRLERAVNLGLDEKGAVKAKFVAGRQLI